MENAPTQEGMKSVEELRQEFEVALMAVENAAAAVGQYEEGRDEVGFGKKDDLEEVKTRANELYQQLLGAVSARGMAEGVKNRNESFDFRVQ
jgi:hypothetical protein